ncbi:hypothetical protein JOY44_02600 [Phormidium sp. CLA17]|uniref:hypothetical protein n=1 Tax=Leptolyngbya sp. Cla-17 TaxID=2803751 RepID=UPI0014927114|nr:hypothetical protein [Leptolyngbya sp. Cla-17]MBM0740516.1 hypothetical protein [Leptolyngbya sp. Cla-17]
MYNPAKFTLTDMINCGATLRKLSAGADSMEKVADQVVSFFYRQFVDPHTSVNALALVRFFKTHPLGQLPTDLQAYAQTMLKQEVPAATKCLTLLATQGDRPEWQSRQASIGHQAIPLISEQLVAQSPMISQLISQFGLPIHAVLDPDPSLIVDLEQKTFNVFHVLDAVDSPHVPAQQEFVVPLAVRSVLGFGGMLPSGNLIAIIVFSKVPISRETADMFKTLALNVKLAVLPFDQGAVFDEQPLVSR